MGDYASTAELETRFEDDAELAYLTDNVAAGEPDDAVLTDVLEAAEGEINSGLAKKYATPVDVSVDSTLAALLKRKTLDLAEVYLHRRGEDASEVKQDQLDQVLEWVDRIAKGERVLVGAVTAASTTSADPRATWTDTSRELPDTSDRIFTRQSGGRL
jgi:phage gp36-like protein